MVEAKRVVWATAGRRPHDGGSWSSASWVGLMCRALAFAYDAARRTKRGGEAREFFRAHRQTLLHRGVIAAHRAFVSGCDGAQHRGTVCSVASHVYFSA